MLLCVGAVMYSISHGSVPPFLSKSTQSNGKTTIFAHSHNYDLYVFRVSGFKIIVSSTHK